LIERITSVLREKKKSTFQSAIKRIKNQQKETIRFFMEF